MEPTQAPLTKEVLHAITSRLRAASDTWFPQGLIMDLEIVIILAYKGLETYANSIPTPIK